MTHSIRWRLVASFAFLTLLSVAAVGVVAVWLVGHYADRRALDGLTANAEHLALQTRPLVEPQVLYSELEELARAAAFLDEVRIRFLDVEGELIVDSGPLGRADHMAWIGIAPELAASMHERLEPTAPSDSPSAPDATGSAPGMLTVVSGVPLPHDGGVVVVRKEGLEEGARFDYILREALVNEGKFAIRTIGGDHAEILPSIAADGPPPGLPGSSIMVPIGEPISPIGFVEMTSLGDPGAEARETAAKAFVLAGLMATLLSMVVGVVVSRTLTAPLAELTTAADRMRRGDLTARAPVRGRDEIAMLAELTNRMADSLQDSFSALEEERDALQRFIADASHELRTPITALKTYNSLLRDTASDDPAAHQEFLTDSQAQIDRLEWITSNLLDLSRLDAGLIDLEMTDHDARYLVESAAAPFRAPAFESRVRIDLQIPVETVPVRCDGPRIELALSNLIENALKFTPSGGTIEVGTSGSVESDEPTVAFWVHDSGPGVPEDEREHVFDRFYQGRGPGNREPTTIDEGSETDPSGAADTPGQTDTPGESDTTGATTSPGSGLGLAIARSLVLVHGGEIRLVSESTAGARFEFEIPAHGADPTGRDPQQRDVSEVGA